MALIKGTAPLLSEETQQAPARPLSSLEAAAAQDDTCVWQRVSLADIFKSPGMYLARCIFKRPSTSGVIMI